MLPAEEIQIADRAAEQRGVAAEHRVAGRRVREGEVAEAMREAVAAVTTEFSEDGGKTRLAAGSCESLFFL